MLNKEKYAKEIIDIACSGSSIGMRNGVLCACNSIGGCIYCDFYGGKTICDIAIKDWSNSEYKETEIDWSKVPVDTPIVVRDRDWTSNEKLLRHFAKFKNNKIYAWTDGRTSYTIKEFGDDYDDAMASWDYAEIAEGVNCSEWYKD